MILAHPDVVVAICALVTVLSGVLMWINRAQLAPFKVLIAANTMAMEKIDISIDKLTDKLLEHGDRITVIETKHAVRHGE